MNKLESLAFDDDYAQLGEWWFWRQLPALLALPSYPVSFNVDIAFLIRLDPNEVM